MYHNPNIYYKLIYTTIMTNNPITISIIIPAFNVEKYIEKCISSLTSQTLNSLELICVDDGSTDSTPKLLDKLARNDTRIKVIHRCNGGLSAARNSGMAIATGKYIGFVDGDDWVDRNMFKGLSDALEKNNDSEIAMCGVETIFKYDEEKSIRKGYDNYFNINKVGEFPIDKNTFCINKPCWNKLYRRSFLCSNGIIFPEGMNNEDEVFHNFVLSRATHITFVKGNWYKYMRYGTGIIADQNKSFAETQTLPDYFTKVWPLLIEYIKRDLKYDILPDMTDVLLSKINEFKGENTDLLVSTLLHRLDYPTVAECIDPDPNSDKRRMLQMLYDLNGHKEIEEPNPALLPKPLTPVEGVEHPMFSFVVPVYNSSKFLHKSMKSLREQSFKNIEIICVNDGSIDSSEQILNDYARIDKRIQVISQENKGAFVARKTGVTKAKGKYLLCIDPDDWIDPNTCSIIDSMLKTNDVDIIQYAVNLEYDLSLFDKGYIKGLQIFFDRSNDVTEGNSEALIRSCFLTEDFLWHYWGKAIRMSVAKEAFAQMPDIKCNFAEDQVAMFYILSYARNLINTEQRLYHYRLGSGISTKEKEALENFDIKLECFELFHQLTLFAKEHYPQNSEIVKKSLDFIFNSMMDNMWRRLIENAKQDDISEWILHWCEKAGTDKVVGYLIKMTTLPDHNNLDRQLENTSASSIETFRNSQNKLQRKNKKHLKVIRLLTILTAILLLTNIITIISFIIL